MHRLIPPILQAAKDEVIYLIFREVLGRAWCRLLSIFSHK